MNSIKVLVISHNCFSNSSNMGITLSSYFDCFSSDNIAQLFFHEEIPNVVTAKTYFRFTDTDALKSIFIRGQFGKAIIPNINLDDSTAIGEKLSSLYNYGRKRTPIIYILRNLIWRLSSWYSKKLKDWLISFNPDVIFFASGDYSFSYRIALKISKFLSKPLVVSCMDDYYIYNRNQRQLFGKICFNAFLKSVRKVVGYSSGIVCLNKKMAFEYRRLFSKPTFIYYKSVKPNLTNNNIREGFCYLGGLSLGRHSSLIKLANIIHSINEHYFVDVFSSESDKKIVNEITSCDAIRFHGKVNAEKVVEIERRAKFLLFIESSSFSNYIRYSLSTKIPEYLASGACLIAFGPNDVASIEYLADNQCACVVENKDDAKALISAFLNDKNEQNRVLNNARITSLANHSREKNGIEFKKWLVSICDKELEEKL